MELVKSVYALVCLWPTDEKFALTLQMRRAATSIPLNIAEGQGRSSSKAFFNHLDIAFGSLCEVETVALIGLQQGYHSESEMATTLSLCGEVARLIKGLQKSIAGREEKN